MIQHDPDCIFVLKIFTLIYAESVIRGDSMISAFRIGPAASGHKLSDIDRAFSELLNHVPEN